MKHIFFIKVMLTMTLLGNFCALESMDWHRETPEEQAPPPKPARPPQPAIKQPLPVVPARQIPIKAAPTEEDALRKIGYSEENIKILMGVDTLTRASLKKQIKLLDKYNPSEEDIQAFSKLPAVTREEIIKQIGIRTFSTEEFRKFIKLDTPARIKMIKDFDEAVSRQVKDIFIAQSSIRPQLVKPSTPLENAREILGQIPDSTAERLSRELDPGKLTEQERLTIIETGDKLLEMNTDIYKDLTPEELHKMITLIRIRGTQFQAAKNDMAKIDESRKLIEQRRAKLKATGKSDAEILSELEPKQSELENRTRESEDRYGIKTAELDAALKKTDSVLYNLELREDAFSLKNAEGEELKSKGGEFCEKFVASFKNSTQKQQSELRELSTPILKKVGPAFLNTQKALLEDAREKIRILDTSTDKEHKNEQERARLDKIIKNAQESISAIEPLFEKTMSAAELNTMIKKQEAKNEKLDQEIKKLESKIRKLKKSKGASEKIKVLEEQLEEKQQAVIKGLQIISDLDMKKSTQIKQKTDELQSLQEELDKLKVEIGDPTKVIQEQLIHMQEMAEAKKKYIASLEKIRQNPESVIEFFEKAIKQREAALEAQSSKGMFKRIEGQAESTTAKKVRESTEAELTRIRTYVEKIKNAQPQDTLSKVAVIDKIIKEYQSSYAESARKSAKLQEQRDSEETKQKSLEYQRKIADLEQRINDGLINSYSTARELFVKQKDTFYAKLYTQAFAAQGFTLNAKLEELNKKRPQTKAIKSQISALKKQIKSLTKDSKNKSIKEALRTNYGNVSARDHRSWLREFLTE